jgi:phage gp36-like protein
MANAEAINLHAIGAETTTGTGTSADIGSLRTVAKLSAKVAAASVPGAGLVVTIQTSPNDSSWRTVKILEAMPAAGNIDATVHGLQRYVRSLWTVPASASFTFSVDGYAHVVYCEPSDIARYAAKDCSLSRVTDAEKADACIAASDLADGYIGGAFELPLAAWGEDLRMRCAQVAASILVARAVQNPEGPDALVFTMKDEAMAWFDRLADGKLSPPGMVDTTPETFDGGAVVVSRTSRGW